MIWLNNLVAHTLPLFPESFVRFFAKKYIAGETLAQAATTVQELNQKNMRATLDYLGEDPENKSECLAAVDIYKKVADEIHSRNLSCGISLKLSHMGLKIDKPFCLDNLRDLVGYAQAKNIFVRIDMEDFSLKADTIEIFLKLKKDFDHVGMVMQAYLRCAVDDANRIIKEKASVRLCKGAYYWEDPKNVYKDMRIINSSYAYLLEKMLAAGCVTAIATHDEAMVFEAIKIIDKLKISKQDYEFQMLYGVQETLRDILVAQGHPVRVYVPFGSQWFAYSVRRLKENPKMISHIFSNLFR